MCHTNTAHPSRFRSLNAVCRILHNHTFGGQHTKGLSSKQKDIWRWLFVLHQFTSYNRIPRLDWQSDFPQVEGDLDPVCAGSHRHAESRLLTSLHQFMNAGECLQLRGHKLKVDLISSSFPCGSVEWKMILFR